MGAASKSVEYLLAAAKQLSAEELAEFTARLGDWQDSDEGGEKSVAMLIEQTREHLSEHDQKRLQVLVQKSEQGTLSAEELQEFRQLASH